MARMNYPEPHPYKVLGLKGASTWGYAQEIPSREQYLTYMEARGLDGSNADRWRERVETVKRNNAADAAARNAVPAVEPAYAGPVETAAPAPTPVQALAAAIPAMPFGNLPHQRSRPETAALEVMSVRVRAGIGARLGTYMAHVRATKQEIVTDVLDAFLESQGF